MPSPPPDGRRLRSERSRTAVIDAMLGLYDAGIVRPTGAQIAEASGVSERSVFRHFADLEDLASSAIKRKLAEVLPFFADPDATGDLPERITALVDQRMVLHDNIGNQAHAASYHAVSSPTIAQAVADRRELLRNQVARQFAPELAGIGRRDARLVLAAADQALSIEAIDYLRTQSGSLSRRDLRSVLSDSLTATFTLALTKETQ